MSLLASARIAVRRLARRPGLLIVLALALLGTVAAYQVRAATDIDVGAPGDSAYIRNFREPATDSASGRTYRPSDAYGYVTLPGIGGGAPYSVTLSLSADAPISVTVIVNGAPYGARALSPAWQDVTLAVDSAHPAALASRDLVVELRAPDNRGVLLDRVRVAPAGAGFVWPALSQVAYALIIAGGVYLLLWRLLGLSASGWGRAAGPAPAIGGGLAVVAMAGALAFARLAWTPVAPRAAIALLAAHALLFAGRPLAAWLAPEARILGALLRRPLLWALLILTALGVVAGYQARHTYDIDLGAPEDQAYAQNFQDRDAEADGGRTFRPAGTYSYLTLPGVGGGAPYSVSLTLKPARPNTPVTVIINGEPFLQTRLSGDWQTQTFTVDAAHPRALASRDVVVELRAPAVRNLLVDRLTVSPQGPGFITPALAQLLYLPGVVLLVYLLLGRALAGYAAARRAPLALAALAALALVGLLAAVHLPLTVAGGHLLATGVLTYALLVLAEPVARRLAPAAPQGARLAAALFAGAFLVRFGAMALPQTVVIDMPYHLKWMRELLNGNVAALTDPHGGLNKPPKGWGLAVYIPKSPLFYFVAAPLAWLPVDLETALDGFVCLLEASVTLFCYGLLARFAPRWGGWRAGLWAGLAYATNPLGYRALSYGILPTIFAQWLNLAFFTLLLAAMGRYLAPAAAAARAGLRRGGAAALGLGLLVVLTAALVAFPTIAVFTSLVTGGLALVWLRRGYRRAGWAVALLLALAWGLAIATYYGVYLAELITTTLPQMLGRPTAGPSAGGAGPTVSWTGPLDLIGWTLGYLVSSLPLLMGLAGLAALWLRAARRGTLSPMPERLLAALTACWMLILPLFVAANYRVDLIGKHLFYTMVPLSLGAGLFLWALARRGGPARPAAWLLMGALGWMALVFWIERLVRASG